VGASRLRVNVRCQLYSPVHKLFYSATTHDMKWYDMIYLTAIG